VKTVLLDDHLLLRVLLGNEPASLRPRGAALATTGLWYHRLCRALTNEFVVGEICLAEQDANEPLVLAAGAVGAPVRIVHD